MKRLAVLLCLSILQFNHGLAQSERIFYSVEAALAVPVDSVFHLDLSKQKLTEIPAEVFTFTALKTLDVSKNSIITIPVEILNLKSLEVLEAEKNRLTKFPIGLCSCLKLKSINLGRNDIEVIPSCIGQLTALEHLDLWDNLIGDLPNSVAKLKQLTFLDLRGINFSQETKLHISALLPWAKIEFDNGCDCGY